MLEVSVYLASFPNGGRDYWMVVRGVRHGEKVVQERPLYLGRLDHLTPERRTELERKVAALGDPKLLLAFHLKLAQLGHPVPPYTATDLVEKGPYPLTPVNFRTLNEALAREDLLDQELAALISRMGIPVRSAQLEELGLRIQLGEKTRSLFLFYRRTSRGGPRSARRVRGGSRSPRGSAAPTSASRTR